MNDFDDDLEFSHSQEAFWEGVYRIAFPDMESMTDVCKDGWAQRGGIDRLITTASGRVWKVDEKVRRETWPDILLETKSDVARNAPGWIVKDLACDFIAYAFLPSRECYLLPVQPLQRAWRQHGHIWLGEYGTREAKNNGWKTENCPVPIKEIMRKISEAMWMRWKPAPPVISATDDPVFPLIKTQVNADDISW